MSDAATPELTPTQRGMVVVLSSFVGFGGLLLAIFGLTHGAGMFFAPLILLWVVAGGIALILALWMSYGIMFRNRYRTEMVLYVVLLMAVCLGVVGFASVF